MKPKVSELDVDFIGGQDPMTKEEELAISEFIKARKLLIARKMHGIPKHHNQKKSLLNSK